LRGLRRRGGVPVEPLVSIAPFLPIGGHERIAREGVQDIGKDQFLMLLLMMKAERDDRFDPGERLRIGRSDEREHRFVDMATIRIHFGQRRARQQPTLGAFVARTECFVIRIEEKRVLLVKERIARRMSDEQHRLEEPCRMRQMPLRRARIGHRLHLLVFL
jgi:hypothetical protein